MAKTFNLSHIPYCTNDIRHYLKSLPTTNEFVRLKQYFSYQKHFTIRLINYQRLLISEYNRQGIRYNNRLYLDKKTFENYGLSPLRLNPNVLIINEKRFNRVLNSLHIHQNSLQDIQKHSIHIPLESKESIDSIDNIESHTDTTIIKLNTCSKLIATGHGITKIISSLDKKNSEELNHRTIDEDISLSKTCKRIPSRSLLRRQINPKSSNIYLFTIPDKLSHKQEFV
jgi:hypothetical protein